MIKKIAFSIFGVLLFLCAKPSFCTLLDKKLKRQEIRIDCAEFVEQQNWDCSRFRVFQAQLQLQKQFQISL